ncbi:MAG: hypothetical protein RSC97_10790 [Eubacterium sp.]
MKSEYFTTWEEYLKNHPQLEEIKEAEIVQDYEEAMYRFAFQLFL